MREETRAADHHPEDRMNIIRMYQPDKQRQLEALLLILRSTPSHTIEAIKPAEDRSPGKPSDDQPDEPARTSNGK